LILGQAFGGVACERNRTPDLSSPKKTVQAFDDALTRNDMALAHSVARGDERQFAVAKEGIEIQHLMYRFATAEAKRFRPEDKTDGYNVDTWGKADQDIQGNKATVSTFLGPSFALEKIGETWRIDLSSSPRIRGFKSANIQNLTTAIRQITEKIEKRHFKNRQEYEAEFETTLRPLMFDSPKQNQSPKGPSVYPDAAKAGVVAGTPQSTVENLPEYTVQQANEHLGENATVLFRVDCIECVTGCYLSFGDCGGDATFFVHLPQNPAGPQLDVHKLKGMTVAVSGTIKHQTGGGLPFIDVQSTSQIALPKEPTPGELEAAISQENKLLEANPKDAKAYYRRGINREKKAASQHLPNDYKVAMEDYEQSLKLDPSNLDALIHLGDCWAALQDYVAARRAWDKAIEGSPETRKLLKDSIAKERDGHMYAAIDDLDKLTNLEPKNAALYYRKGELYLMDHASEEANENFKIAAELEPTNSEYSSRAANPVAPSKRQMTVDEMKDAAMNALGAGVLGAAAISSSNHSSPAADASGGSQDSRRLCPTCGGRGSVQSYEWDMSGRTKVLSSRTCPTCLGSGYVH
jgi:hypothetical protein